MTGLPELRPGEYIEIGEIGSMIDGRYSVVSVRYSIGADGFQSEVTLGG